MPASLLGGKNSKDTPLARCLRISFIFILDYLPGSNPYYAKYLLHYIKSSLKLNLFGNI
jgi:hypothetical protein